MERNQLKYAGITVAVHLAIGAAHGLSHLGAQVGLSLFQSLFIGLVITIAPLVSLVLLRRSRQAGALLFFLSMLGSLLFGLANHYLIPGPDHVGHVSGQWQAQFSTTAALLVMIELTGTILGAVMLQTKPGTEVLQ